MKYTAFIIGIVNVITVCNCGKLFSGFSFVTLPFRYHKITPNFLEEPPKQLLQVEFEAIDTNLGNKVTASQVTNVPIVIWNCDRAAYYTLVMFDCDPLGQDNRLLSEAQHWVVGNIPNCEVEQGETIVDYLPAIPLSNTGFHRYVFLIYLQEGRIHFEEPFIRSTQLKGRYYSTIEKFALKYDLGRPLAGNFLLCEYDARTDETLDELEPNLEYVDRAIARASIAHKSKDLRTYG